MFPESARPAKSLLKQCVTQSWLIDGVMQKAFAVRRDVLRERKSVRSRYKPVLDVVVQPVEVPDNKLLHREEAVKTEDERDAAERVARKVLWDELGGLQE